MSKNKNELAVALNTSLEIICDLLEATDHLQLALKKVPRIVGVIRRVFDIPDDPDESDKDEPEAVSEKPKAASPKKKVTEPEPTEEEKTYTKAEVRQFLAGIAKTHREEVKALLDKYGADNLTHLDEKHYAAVMAEAEAIADA